jgi:lambda family phage portal protein
MSFMRDIARVVATHLFRIAAKGRSYDASKLDRLSLSFPIGPTSMDQDVRQGIVPVRARARYLEQNDSYGSRYLKLVRKNIPGAYGFALKMKVVDIDTKGNKIPDKHANAVIEEAFRDWSRRQNCDVTGQESFRSIQHIVITHAKRDGEFLVRGVRNSSKYGFQLEVLEPDILDETYTVVAPNGNVVIMGIEFDKNRRRVAYWLRKWVPGISAFSMGFVADRTRVPADQIYYGFDKTRAFQSRGISEMAPSMLRMSKISEYESANLTNATIAARRLGFIQPQADQAPSEFVGDGKDTEGNITIDTEEGSYHLLPKGYEVNQPASNFPDAQFESFMKMEGKRAASGLDVAYITLGNDLTETSFSSGRVGLLDERESWMMGQEWMIESFLEPLFASWLEAGLLNGAIALDGRRRDPLAEFDYYDKPYFVGKRWPWVDPTKDAEATLMKLRAGLTSLVREAAQNGDELEEILEEAARANELAKKYGVTLNFDAKPGAPLAGGPDPQEPGATAPAQPKKTNGTLVGVN